MSTQGKPESALAKTEEADVSPTQESTGTSQQEARKQPDPVRRSTRILLAIVVLLFVWYVLADRFAPWTDQARVQAWIVPITPKVSGKVKEVAVVQQRYLDPGQLPRE